MLCKWTFLSLYGQIFILLLYFSGLCLVVKCHLSRLMGERKLKISDVARDTGLHRGTISRLYKETAVRVDFESLGFLCRYLRCSIGELLELSEE